jgi:hypothetical protein
MQRIPQTPVNFAAGKANTLLCGAPLQVNVTAVPTKVSPRGLLVEDGATTKSNSDAMLRINASIAGAGGEAYSSFQKGEGFRSQPPKPSFTIVQAGGKTVASGNLEYG